MEFFQNIPPLLFARMAIMIFFAILFLQSGWDKIRDRKGNLEWMVPHFANSPLKNMVPFLLTIITIVELSAGAGCVWGFTSICRFLFDPLHFTNGVDEKYFMVSSGTFPELNLALCLVGIALLQLFLGQRLAKDYPGAASLAGYFGVAILGFIVVASSTGPFVLN